MHRTEIIVTIIGSIAAIRFGYWMLKNWRNGQAAPSLVPASRSGKPHLSEHPEIVRLLQDREETLEGLRRHEQLAEQLQFAYKSSKQAIPGDAVRICEEMIAIAPEAKASFENLHRIDQELCRLRGDLVEATGSELPQHPGFKQLTNIKATLGEFESAVALAHQARTQGWAGNWDSRIERLSRRIDTRPGDRQQRAPQPGT